MVLAVRGTNFPVGQCLMDALLATVHHIAPAAVGVDGHGGGAPWSGTGHVYVDDLDVLGPRHFDRRR